MKKIISCLILCVMLLTIFPISVFAVTAETQRTEVSLADYLDGNTSYSKSDFGTIALTVGTPAELNKFITSTSPHTNLKGAYILLTNDINFSDYTWTSIIFDGTFDGGGHKISNITITTANSKANAMFRLGGGVYKNLYIDAITNIQPDISGVGALIGRRDNSNVCLSNLVIDNVHITNATIKGKEQVGGIIGTANAYVSTSGYEDGINTEVQIINSSFGGSVTGVSDTVGGIIGYGVNSSKVTVDNCQVNATVNGGAKNTGGVIGYTKVLTNVTRTTVSGSVTGSSSQVGGVVGLAQTTKLTVKNCIVTANVKSEATGTSATDACAGGIVGQSEIATDIINCSVAANVGGIAFGRYIGGVVGYYTTGTLRIENVSFVGNVDNKSNGGGGLVGFLYSGTVDINKCVVNASVTGSGNHKGGLIGRSSSATKNNTINVDDCIVLGSLIVPNGCTYASGIVAWMHDPNSYTTSLNCNNVIVAIDVIHNMDSKVFTTFAGVQTKASGSSYTFTNLYYDSTLMTSEKIAGQFNFEVDNTDNKAWSAKSTTELQSLSLTGWSNVKDSYPVPTALNGTATYGYQKTEVADNTIDYRIVGMLNTDDLASVKDIGFYVTVTDGTKTISQKVSCKKVFSSVIGGGITYNKGNGTDTDTVEYIGGDHLYVLVFEDYPSSSNFTAKLTSYSTDAEDNENFGVTKVITLKP